MSERQPPENQAWRQLLALELPGGCVAELPSLLERVPAKTRVEDWVWTRDFAVPLVERPTGVVNFQRFARDRFTAQDSVGVVGVLLAVGIRR